MADDDGTGKVVNPRNMVQALAKGFAVLQSFSAREPELTLTEIANRAGLDKGTAFRMLTTLVHLGYIEKVIATRRFRLMLKVLDLGFTAISQTGLAEVARPVLGSLVDTAREAASLGVLDGTEVIYVERVRAGIVRLGVDLHVGNRIPVYCTAIGHAILAWLPPDECDRVLAASDIRKLTPRTPTTIEEILLELEEARARGYAVSDQVVNIGLRVLAAPVLDSHGYPLAAVSVVSTPYHMSLDEFVASTAERIVEAAAKISRAMQATGQSRVYSTEPSRSANG